MLLQAPALAGIAGLLAVAGAVWFALQLPVRSSDAVDASSSEQTPVAAIATPARTPRAGRRSGARTSAAAAAAAQMDAALLTDEEIEAEVAAVQRVPGASPAQAAAVAAASLMRVLTPKGKVRCLVQAERFASAD